MPIHNITPFGAPEYVGGVAVSSKAATLAALKALAVGDPSRRDGNEVEVAADGSRWYFHPTSTLAGDDVLVATPADAPAAGRWLRATGLPADLALAFDFNKADAAVLITVPAGCRLRVGRGYWDVDTGFTGGSSSAIGLSSSNASYNTKGDLLGGASGDVAATLVAGVRPGTIGAKTAAGIILVAGDTVRFDRVTSAFTAGAGRAHLICDVLLNAGA